MTQLEHIGRLLTADELARRLNVGSAMVREMERAGRIPSIRLGRKTVRFDFAEVVAALRADERRAGGNGD